MSGRGLLDADMRTIGALLATGVRWWVSELAAMVPRRWRGGDATRGPLVLYDPEAPLGIVTAGGEQPLRPGDLSRPAKVALPPGLCLIRQIERPGMSDRDVARMLALDGDRIMPLPGGAMIVAGRVLPRAPGGDRITIEVAGLPVARATGLAATLAVAGVEPLRIFATPPRDGGEPSVDLLPAMRDAGLFPARRDRAAPWWAAVGFLFLLNAGILIWRDVARVDRLEDIVATQQPAVDAAHKIVARINRANVIAARVTVLRERRQPLDLLARINRVLPEGAWIQRFSWQGDTLKLAGYRPRTADVAGALRKAGGFTGVHYTDTDLSAATPIGQPFEITARIGSR